MFQALGLGRISVITAALGTFAAVGVAAQGQGSAGNGPGKAPDAQVEANVLKALAGASDLTNQPITTTTVFGTVTLSGSVQTEAQRSEAETIASRIAGVQKVVDELTLGASAGVAPTDGGSQLQASAQETNPNLQSDGTVARPQAQGAPNAGNPQSQSAGPSYGPGAPEYRQPYGGAQQAPPAQYPSQSDSQQGFPQQGQGYPQQGPGYPQQGPAYPQQGTGYPQQGPGYPQQQGYPQGGPGYGANPPAGYPKYNPGPDNGQNYGGQQAGESVTIPSGAMIRIRINQTLDSGRTQAGTTFNGTVVNDIVAGGAVAIPRGASVQGTVVDAKKSGALSGRGEMSLQLTQVTLGGQSYPIVSDVWAHNGGDKTIQTVNSTAVGTGIGALFGAVAGGGVGAAVGAGVGGALGLGASAASGAGQVYIPSEGLLTFHITQPATVDTVSQEEMNRLAQGAGPNGDPRQLRRRYAYPPAPYSYPYAYYGGYYRPYYYPYR